MKITDFDFILPENLIAERPLNERAGSRLLVVHKSGALEHKNFSDLPSHLEKGDMLIINNTKVFPARLTCFKESGAKLEILLVRRINDEEWEVLSKGSFTGRLKVSEELRVDLYKGSSAQFRYSGDFMDILRRCGSMPIPPYIKRLPDQSDKESYQTIFAKKEGSIAAPTAGLHFTDALLKKIEAAGVKIRELTLHVGVGTFKPIRTDNVDEHSMDAEHFEMDKKLVSEMELVKAAGKRVITVGTTTTRALEGYISGQYDNGSNRIPFFLPHSGGFAVAKKEYKGGLQSSGLIRGTTNIFIYPGYPFKIVDALVTNFHLPRSTPLMLVSAFAGREKLFAAYQEAIAKSYRFLSYGDAMLIL